MAAKTGVVQVSGRGTNVNFTIDDSPPFDEVVRGLRQYLVDNRRLWSKGIITVNAGRWTLSRDRLTHIKEVIETESGLTVSRFWCSPDRIDGAPPETNGSLLVSPPPVEATPEPAVRTSKPESTEKAWAPLISRGKLREPKLGGSRKGLPTEALFIRTTFRSGESVNYPGDVVVLADVNPGAEIVAEGDIVVFGSLRGVAHAGAAGDTKATIIALDLGSPRIQIGPYVGLAPAAGSGVKTKRVTPRIAYLRRRSIYVAPYAGRFAKYSRGIPYEG